MGAAFAENAERWAVAVRFDKDCEERGVVFVVGCGLAPGKAELRKRDNGVKVAKEAGRRWDMSPGTEPSCGVMRAS